MSKSRAARRHAADHHDLIRVHGARVNNLKDVSVELPKRRLTVFTGISPSDRAAISDLLAKGLLGWLNFSTSDLEGIFDRVQATGAEVVQEPMDQFYGDRDCAFRDPAGNLIRISQTRG